MYAKFYIGIFFLTYVFIQLNTADARTGLGADRQRLWHGLFRDYMKDIAPDGADGGPVVVNHSLSVGNPIAWENDILSFRLLEVISWTDSRLKWNPAMFNGVDEIQIPSRLFWQPDIVLYNSVDEYRGFVAGDLNGILNYDGRVLLVPPRITRTFCAFNESLLLENKEIVCSLKYGSWTRSAQDLDLQLSRQPEFADYASTRWTITDMTGTRNVNKYSCCPETYIDIVYTFTMGNSLQF